MGWAIVIFLSIVSLSAAYKITTTIYTKQIELAELNTLYKCDKCGKFHRKYQEIIQMNIDSDYHSHLICPKCYGPSSLYTGKEYDWIKKNPESPRLKWRDLRKLKKTIRQIENLAADDETIEKFLYYYHLLPKKKKNR